MKLSLFSKRWPDCENESLNFVNCVGRFIIDETPNLDVGKRRAF